MLILMLEKSSQFLPHSSIQSSEVDLANDSFRLMVNLNFWLRIYFENFKARIIYYREPKFKKIKVMETLLLRQTEEKFVT